MSLHVPGEDIVGEIDGIVLLPVNDFRVYFCRFNLAVSHQLADGIKVGSKGQHHRAEGMAAGVECHRLVRDSGIPCPFPDNLVDERVGWQGVEHQILVRRESAVGKTLDGRLREGKIDGRRGLLHDDRAPPLAVVARDVLPSELADIRTAESAEDGEKERLLDILPALHDGGVYHPPDLLDGEVGARALVPPYPVDGGDPAERVLVHVLPADGHIEGGTEYDAIAVGGRVGQEPVAARAAVLLPEEIDEARDKLPVYLAEGNPVAPVLD